MSCCHVHNHCLVVRLPAEIDHYQAEIIRQECEIMFLQSLICDVIFDFSRTIFMDSSGIGLIIGRVRQMNQVNGRVFLFGGSPALKKMWEMSGLPGLVTILDTIEEMKEVYQ